MLKVQSSKYLVRLPAKDSRLPDSGCKNNIKFASIKDIIYLCKQKQIYYQTMPTLFIFFGFRFMFYSNDHEPIHVHVIKGDSEARFQVQPEVELIDNRGLKTAELKLAESIVEDNKELIIERWNSFFKDKINA